MKKIISLVLSACLICSFSIVGFALDTADYEFNGASITLDGSEDKTVELTFNQTKEKNIIALEGSFSTKEMESSNYVTLTEFKSPVQLSGTNYSDVESGKIVYVDSNLEGYAVSAGGAAMTVVYKVSKDAPAGDYTVQFNATNVEDYDFSRVKNQIYTATITVTRESVYAAERYTVTLSSDASTTGVAKGVPFNVNLDVTNSDSTVTDFNAFYAVLTYDSSKVFYSGDKKVGDFTVNSDTDGRLEISRVGENASMSSGHELALSFTMNVAEEISLTLTKANVDQKVYAETRDAPDAATSGSPLSVIGLETYTITFAGGEGAAGTAPTIEQNPVTAGTEITMPANTFTKEGYTFSKWNDGENDYEVGGKYTVNQDVTFTAIWTQDPVVPSVTNVPGENNTDAYQPEFSGSGESTGSQLIAAKINTEGYIPTYKGDQMYLVEGYENDTYYYVIPSTETYDTGKLDYIEGSQLIIAKSTDVNQTDETDINDAQFVYNIYNDKTWPTKNEVVRMILADTNRDGVVNTSDCATVVSDIK